MDQVLSPDHHPHSLALELSLVPCLHGHNQDLGTRALFGVVVYLHSNAQHQHGDSALTDLQADRKHSMIDQVHKNMEK